MMEKTALFIIDVQREQVDFSHSDLVKKIEALQGRYQNVAVIRLINPPGSPWEKWIGWTRCQQGSPESELSFTPAPHASLFVKDRYSALTPEVLEWLEDRKIDAVHLAGFRTENCILKTAVDLFETGRYRPCVLAAYCHSRATHLHEAALEILEKFIGRDQIVYE